MSGPPAGGERGGAHRPKQRQSLGLCPAATRPAEGRGYRLTSLLAPRGDPEHRDQERDATAAAHLGGPGRSPRPRARALQSNLCSAAGRSPSRPSDTPHAPRRPPPRWAPPRAGPGRGNPSPREALALRPLGLAGTRTSQPTLAVAGPAPGAEHSPTESAVGVAGLTCCSLQVLVGWWAEEVGWEGGETLLKLAGQHIPRKYLPC